MNKPIYRTTHARLPIEERIRRFCQSGEPTKEYQLQKMVSIYLNTYYQDVEYRVDMAGSNLSKAQSGKSKQVNKRRGWHDLEIYDPSGEFLGMCIELKVAKTKLRLSRDSSVRAILKYTKSKNKFTGKVDKVAVRENFKRKQGDYVDLHIEEQAKNIQLMRERHRCAGFGVGVEQTIRAIEAYFSDEPVSAYDYLKS